MLKEQKATSGETKKARKRGRKAGAIYFPRDPLLKILPIAEAIGRIMQEIRLTL